MISNKEGEHDRSYMVHKATGGETFKLNRAKGVYTIEAYVQKKSSPKSAMVFRRQGS